MNSINEEQPEMKWDEVLAWIKQGIPPYLRKDAAFIDEIVQEVSVQLLKRRPLTRFDPKRGSLRAYIIGITRFVARRMQRTQQRLNTMDVEPEDNADRSIDRLCAKEVLCKLVAGLMALSDEQRRAIIRQTGCPCCGGSGDNRPINNEYVQRHRGLNRLKQLANEQKLQI
jgi:hypothetical protein